MRPCLVRFKVDFCGGLGFIVDRSNALTHIYPTHCGPVTMENDPKSAQTGSQKASISK